MKDYDGGYYDDRNRRLEVVRWRGQSYATQDPEVPDSVTAEDIAAYLKAFPEHDLWSETIERLTDEKEQLQRRIELLVVEKADLQKQYDDLKKSLGTPIEDVPSDDLRQQYYDAVQCRDYQTCDIVVEELTRRGEQL